MVFLRKYILSENNFYNSNKEVQLIFHATIFIPKLLLLLSFNFYYMKQNVKMEFFQIHETILIKCTVQPEKQH